ncbi:hypothetical protein FOZ63_009660 [Perkinsus olseni]|uniref:Uncharacterized protein n=1 Tax=Perkinsus olseni TaxID=32597 RepID=A0A7J6TUZ2_PEROL|nr:hypothetical protein FOZ62_014799 [Perkinsus olseni]KAF4758786.1 hypothetical protein FOZ63_009660 [Perkinsus olseni]
MTSSEGSLCNISLASLSPNVKADLSNWESTQLQSRLSAVQEQIQRTLKVDTTPPANSDTTSSNAVNDYQPATAQEGELASDASGSRESQFPDELSKERRYERMQEAVRLRVRRIARVHLDGTSRRAPTISSARPSSGNPPLPGEAGQPKLKTANGRAEGERLRDGGSNLRSASSSTLGHSKSNRRSDSLTTPRRRGPFKRESDVPGSAVLEPKPLRYAEIHSAEAASEDGDARTGRQLELDASLERDGVEATGHGQLGPERGTPTGWGSSGRSGEECAGYSQRYAAGSKEGRGGSVRADSEPRRLRTRVKPVARRLSLGRAPTGTSETPVNSTQGINVISGRGVEEVSADRPAPHARNGSYSEIYSHKSEREADRSLATPVHGPRGPTSSRVSRAALTPRTAPSRGGDIYSRARERRKMFEERVVEARSLKSAEEMRECTFSPRVTPRKASQRSASVPRNLDSIYQRTRAWKDEREKALEWTRRRREEAKDMVDQQHLVHKSVHSGVMGMPYSTVEASRFYERNMEWKREVDRRSETLRQEQQQVGEGASVAAVVCDMRLISSVSRATPPSAQESAELFTPWVYVVRQRVCHTAYA